MYQGQVFTTTTTAELHNRREVLMQVVVPFRQEVVLAHTKPTGHFPASILQALAVIDHPAGLFQGHQEALQVVVFREEDQEVVVLAVAEEEDNNTPFIKQNIMYI
jgi:hypothetical protein